MLEAWAWLPLVVAVVVIGAAIQVGLLSKDWTGVVVAGAGALPLYDYSKKLRAKLLRR